MSLECSECEHDLRAEHDINCSRHPGNKTGSIKKVKDNAITKDNLICMALILEDIAADLKNCGTDEWESLEDCFSATVNNVTHDLSEYINI